MGRVQEAVPQVEVEEELEWEAKEILDSKVERGKLLYFVDWAGYGPESRTWEPPEHVENSRDAVTHYHHAYPHRPSPHDIPKSHCCHRRP